MMWILAQSQGDAERGERGAGGAASHSEHNEDPTRAESGIRIGE